MSSDSELLPPEFDERNRNHFRGRTRRQINNLVAKFHPETITQYAQYRLIENAAPAHQAPIWRVTEVGYSFLAGKAITYQPLGLALLRAIIEQEIDYQATSHRGQPQITTPEPDTFRAEWHFFRDGQPASTGLPQEMILEAGHDHQGWVLHFWYGFLSESCRYRLEVRFVGNYLPESDVRHAYRRCTNCGAKEDHYQLMVTDLDDAYERLRKRIGYFA